MEFFKRIKGKLLRRNILWAVLAFVLTVAGVSLAVDTGFSTDKDWRIGPRYSDIGIPLPNWVFTIIMLLATAAFLALFIKQIVSIARNSDYNELIASVSKIGDANAIGSLLGNTPKSPLVKSGDLRVNPPLLFYMTSVDVTVVALKDIASIRPQVSIVNGKKEYHVVVEYGEKKIHLETTRDHMIPLVQMIVYAVNASVQA